MKIYGVDPDGKFREYVPTPFQIEHREAILEDWLEENPDGILEDGKLLVIGRQINTNLGSTIDLLCLDRDGGAVVIELKRDRTPRDTLAQALEYASFAEQLTADQLEGILQSVFKKILAFAQTQPMPIHWGTRGFSLNVDIDGIHVAVFFCYPPRSVYRQSIYTTLMGRGGISMKTVVPENEVRRLWDKALAIGPFRRAGRELKCSIDRAFTESEIGELLSWCQEAATTIAQYGLKE